MKNWFEVYDQVTTHKEINVNDFFKTPYKVFNPYKAKKTVTSYLSDGIKSQASSFNEEDLVLYKHSFNSAHFRGLIAQFKKFQESVEIPLVKTSEDRFFQQCQLHLLRFSHNVYSLFYTEYLLSTPNCLFHQFCEHVMDYTLSERFYYFSFWNGIMTEDKDSFLEQLINASMRRALQFTLGINQLLVQGDKASTLQSTDSQTPLSHFSTMKDVKPFEDFQLSLTDLLSPAELYSNIGGILTTSDKYVLREVFHDLRDFLLQLYKNLLKQIGHYSYIYQEIVYTATITRDVIQKLIQQDATFIVAQFKNQRRDRKKGSSVLKRKDHREENSTKIVVPSSTISNSGDEDSSRFRTSFKRGNNVDVSSSQFQSVVYSSQNPEVEEKREEVFQKSKRNSYYQAIQNDKDIDLPKINNIIMNILHHTNIFEEGSEDEGAAGGQEKYASIDKYKEETPQEKIQRGFEREKKKRKIGKMKNFLQSQMVQGQKKDLFKMQEIRQQHRIVNLDIDEQVSEVATVEQRRLQKGATLSDFIRKKEASHIFQNKKLLDSQDHPDFEKRKREMEKSKKDKNQLGKVMEEIKSVYVDKYAETLAKIQLEIDQKEIEKKAKLEEKKSNPAFIQEQEQDKPEKTVKTSELKYKKRKEAKKILPKLSPTITSSNTTIMGHFPEEPEVSEAVGKLVDETFTSRKDSSSSVTVEDSTDIAMEDLTRHEQNELIGKYPGESIKAFNDKRMDIDKKEHRSKREERKHQDSWHNLFKEEMTITNFKRVKQMDKVEPKPNKKLFKLGGFDAHFD